MADKYQELKNKALAARRTVITESSRSGSVHIASSLSEIDLLTALYSKILQKKDKFILSKGHGALGYYAVLAEYGFIPREELNKYGQDGTKLSVHPVYKTAPGIEASTGSLGHGLPMALGLALAARQDKNDGHSYVLLSDGECDEGSTWEAAMLAGHLKLDNLVAIIDYNKFQAFGKTKDILDLEPFADKWQAAKWAVKEINGHNFEEIINALEKLPLEKNKPTVFIAHTVKGKGVPYMENKLDWHYFNVKAEDLDKTLEELY
ncbi:MAG: transketolase [Candidatus Komeilibacteria bacterium]|jgi:transketolase|nr:transketolase [Candidatus Komeilibacteria bacterium]MBT4448024.1 transketolase [Candidatus Komeilibacteria bacterium]